MSQTKGCMSASGTVVASSFLPQLNWQTARDARLKHVVSLFRDAEDVEEKAVDDCNVLSLDGGVVNSISRYAPLPIMSHSPFSHLGST